MAKRFFWLLLLLPLALAGCHEAELRRAGEDTAAPLRVDAATPERQRRLLDEVIPRLARKRVVYVGETHSNYGHHLLQLEIIRGLYRLRPGMAIGLEFFQQPFQQVLDAYIGGEITEREMLARAEWYDRWIYDYRLYRPILRFAREKGIPVVALNVPMEIIGQVSRKGIGGLSEDERAALPTTIDTSDARYRERLRRVFEQHQRRGGGRSFDRFMDVQLSWDEGMAEQIADYLKRHPERYMVVLAGSGHLMYGSGIPSRVRRRLPLEDAIVLPGDDLKIEPGISDLVVVPVPARLPPAGLMGVMIGNHGDGVMIQGVAPGSAAASAGLRTGDMILSIDGTPVKSTSDVKIGMLDRRPGERLPLRIRRDGRTLELELRLDAAE
ncbi:MAG TPA: PDZ domain-containing protein [Sedimenticola thiotaurini]|uniref:PDZ domain-containing protein n=1 Tax=Sedimenticola thiotaurini TaxID=1543721 RepID=A0A831RLC1_9GAMM|nr:PDZ domain-containing protein [Sedimenticola thiotaurini]